MSDSINTDEQPSNRRSKRASRLSALPTQPSIEPQEPESLVEDIEVDEEDPPELYQPGDILWVHVSGNPWWPALVYGSYYENYIHTKVHKTIRRNKTRRYFVYFFGPSFEFAWALPNQIIAYAGLEEFIRQAETAVQNAPNKTVQDILASRYSLKVVANKRASWDKSIEEADAAFKLTREQRIENFAELLKNILSNAEKNQSRKRRHSSITTRESSHRKTSSPTADKSTTRSSVKRQRTTSTPTVTTALLHVGIPILTKREEKRIVNTLMEHSNPENFKLNEAKSFVCKLVTEIIKENSHYDMSCVQIEWFYDFLLNHPDIVYKYSHWFNEDIKPIKDDPIYTKQRQLKAMIENQQKSSDI